MIAAVRKVTEEWDHHFVESLPKKPYCSDELKSGIVIRSKGLASHMKYLQPNHPEFIRYLIFDVDREWGAWRWESEGLPPPAWAVVNRSNGYAHLVYPLKMPVSRTNASRLKPLQYLAVIEEAYRDRLQADPGYSGLLTKNPLHEFWGLTIFLSENIAYDLADLAGWIDLSKSKKKQKSNNQSYGVGRNCTMFDNVRRWAYKTIPNFWGVECLNEWEKAVSRECESVNGQFKIALPESEIRGMAKSIARWTWKKITPEGKCKLVLKTHTREIQSRNGKKGAEKKKSVAETNGIPGLLRLYPTKSRSGPNHPIMSRKAWVPISDNSPQGVLKHFVFW